MLSVKPLDLLLILTVMVIWGLNFVVAKIGLAQMPPILFMGLRFGLVAILLLPFLKGGRAHVKELFFLSLTLGVLHFTLMFTALRHVDASTAAITVQIQVPFATLIAYLVYKEPVGWRRVLGTIISFIGVALVVGEPRLGGQYLYLAMIIGGAMVWALANLQMKSLQHVNGFTVNAWMALFAGPMLIGSSFLLEEGQLEALRNADVYGYLAVIFQSVAVVMLGYGIWYHILKRYGVSQAMPFTLLVPPLGVLFGVLMLGEPFTWWLVIGGGLTLLGVAIIIIRRPPGAREVAPDA